MTDTTEPAKKTKIRSNTKGTVRIDYISNRYTVDASGHYRVAWKGDEEVNTQIVNARVQILAAYADDTGEPYPLTVTDVTDRAQSKVTHYDLRVSRKLDEAVELPDVPVEEFNRCDWVERAELGVLRVPVATIAGASAKHDIMTAIKLASPYPVIPAYGRLGWHQRDGRWIYIHGGGAWCASGGVPDLRVHGDGITAFTMSPVPADTEAGCRAFDALWGLFGMGPDRFAAIEIGAAFRASMGRPTGSITYRALNMSGKSARQAFITQSWSPACRWNRLPFNAGKAFATPTYIEHVHHTFGDMIVVWDDMAPVGSTRERADYFDLFARSLFNGASKGRMGIVDRKITARARLRPRAFGSLSAEDLTAVESGQNRTHILPLTREEFDPKAFETADAGTGPADRSALMSAFIVWWAAKMPAHAYVAELEGHYRTELSRMTGAPSRYVESVADKAAGLHCGLAFAREQGWVTDARADELWAWAWSGLCESLCAQVDAIAGQSMPDRIRDSILDGLSAREAHVLGTAGDKPNDAPLFGWDGPIPRGRMIGWTDGERLFLLPSAAGAFVSDYSGRAGAPIEITPRAMGEALEAAGYITGSDENRNGRIVHRHTVAKKVCGRKQVVWSMRVPEDREDTEPTGFEPAPPPPTEAPPIPARCHREGCTEPLRFDDGSGYHATCDPAAMLPQVADQQVSPVPAPRGAEEIEHQAADVVPAPAAVRQAYGVLTEDGSLILADGSRVELSAGFLASVRHLGDLATLHQDHGVKAVHVPATVAALLGLPDGIGPVTWDKGSGAHPFTDAAREDGWDIHPQGLAPWMTAFREGEKGNGGSVVFPGWNSSVEGWRDADAEHVAATLALVKAKAGVDYHRTPQTTMGHLVASVERKHTRTRGLVAITSPDIRYGLSGIYAPPLAPGVELEGMWLHLYDVNKQYASACRGTDLATSAYEHQDHPEVPRYPLPGFWRLRIDVTELRPRSGLRPVVDPARIKGRTWDGWVPTPTLVLLRDAKRKFDVLEAWVSPTKRRFLDEPMGIVTAGVAELRKLSKEAGDPEHTASDILKTSYASWVNGTLRSDFNGGRREGDRWYRPDVTAMVQAQADARKMRLLIAAHDVAPLRIVTDETDAVVILSADPDASTAVPGLELDPAANGKFKHEASMPVTPEMVKMLRNAKRVASGRCVDIKTAIKAHGGNR